MTPEAFEPSCRLEGQRRMVARQVESLLTRFTSKEHAVLQNKINCKIKSVNKRHMRITANHFGARL